MRLQSSLIKIKKVRIEFKKAIQFKTIFMTMKVKTNKIQRNFPSISERISL
jgi:hypothetical protein